MMGCKRCWGDGYVGFKSPFDYPMEQVEFCDDCEKGKQSKEYWQKKSHERHLLLLEKKFDDARIPPEYRDRRIGDWAGDQRRAVRMATEMALAGSVTMRSRSGDETKKPWIYMYGDFGRGKTTLCCSILMERIAQGASGLFAKVSHIIAETQDTYGAGKGGTKAILDKYANADVLYLDEMGKAFMHGTYTDNRIEIMTHIIGERYDFRRPTIISSNLSLIQLKEKLRTEELTSRIGQKAAVVELVGPNYREIE